MSFGSRIISVRKERKISQSELAEKAGIHSNVLGRYEREEATPSVDTAARLADILGVSLDYLAGKTDVLIDQVILDKVIAIQKLPQKDKEHIVYALDNLIKAAQINAL